MDTPVLVTVWARTLVATGAVVSTTSLFTVTETVDDVVVLPAASVATAASRWAPGVAVVVSQATVYGAAVLSAPRFAPSRRSCTVVTPTLSAAFAVTATVPLSVDPAVGAAIETVGASVSAVELATIRTVLATDGTPEPLTRKTM